MRETERKEFFNFVTKFLQILYNVIGECGGDMPCNLNFNQCNLGCGYPRQIFTCRRNFLDLLTNDSPNTIVQPVLDSSFLLSTISSGQIVQSGEFVLSQISFMRDNSVIYDNLGSFILNEGRYIVSYSVGGIIPSGGRLALGMFMDGYILDGGQNWLTGGAGSSVNFSASHMIVVERPSAMINLRNIVDEAFLINNGSITIQRV